MNFTREPIIETIITPREGYKLIVRSSKALSQEEYSIDALEIVSFGSAIFYRSTERPKPFLVPIGDFEVVEVKETRVILKNVNLERSIKIGGGREAPFKQPRESERPAPVGEEESVQTSSSEQHLDKKRDRRRRRHRRGGERPEQSRDDHAAEGHSGDNVAEEGGGAREEIQVSSPTFSTLIPPPTTLISQTIGRYKDQAIPEGNTLPPPVEPSLATKPEEPTENKKDDSEEKKKRETNSDTEISDLYRVSSYNTTFYQNDTYFIT